MLGKRIIVIFSVIFVAVLIGTPYNSSADYQDYFVTYDVFFGVHWDNIQNLWTTSIEDVDNFGSGFTETDYGVCYYYLMEDEEDRGFENSEYMGDWESTESWDDGPYLNPFGVTEDFFVVAIVNNSRLLQIQTYTNITESSEISRVAVVAKFYIGVDMIPEGWLSIQYNAYYSGYELVPWLQDSPKYYENSGAEKDSGGWVNSSLIPYMESTAFFVDESVFYRWDVTEFYEWDYEMLINDNLYIMWTGKQNCSDRAKLSYLGLYYEFGKSVDNAYDNIDYLDEYNSETDFPEMNVDNTFSGLIWLIVIYFPVIALTYNIPKLGFVIGMSLMLFIIGLTHGGFFSVTVLGMMGLGILLYRG